MLFRRPFLLVAVLASLFALLAFAYLGHFTRYIADDYCTTNIALSQGLIGSIVQWYNTWAGQYTNWLLKGIVAYLGPDFPALLPALILLLWLGATVWTVNQIGTTIRLSPYRSFALCVAVGAVFAVFAGIPSIIQSLYWFGASIPYTIPLAVLIFYTGYFVRALRHTPPGQIPLMGLLISLVITLLSGGTSEVFASIQIAVTGLLLIGSFLAAPPTHKRAALWLSGAALLGSAIALVLIIIAPGTAIRQAEFTQRLSMPEVVIQTVLASLSYMVIGIGIFSPIPLLITLVLTVASVLQFTPRDLPIRLRPGQARKLLALSAGVAFILLMASFAPSFYAVGTTPPARVYVFPQVVLVTMACFWGAVMGLTLKPGYKGTNRIVGAFVALLLVVGPLFIAAQALAATPQFSTYASEWDARDQTIRAAVTGGASRVDVKMLSVDIGSMAALETIGPDPDFWVNQCAANYYGLKTLVAQTTLQMGDKASAGKS